MNLVTVGCVSLVLAIGTSQLVSEGLQQFLYRPPGVGASPSEAQPQDNQVATVPPPPKFAVLVPPAILPVQATVRQHDRHERSRR
jgi:hypothetical protein